jgi:hypothetical protein
LLVDGQRVTDTEISDAVSCGPHECMLTRRGNVIRKVAANNMGVIIDSARLTDALETRKHGHLTTTPHKRRARIADDIPSGVDGEGRRR